ncbi:MAG: GAF domain-containing protein [Acidobacteria bacterium]|nr:GAF domain-containing protein [Acidobacteriota bacterium]
MTKLAQEDTADMAGTQEELLAALDRRTGERRLDVKDENERLRRAVEELSILNELARQIGGTTDGDEVISAIIETSRKAVSAEQGVITLVERDEEVSSKTLARVSGASDEVRRYHIAEMLLGWMLFNKKPLRLNDPRADKRFSGIRWDDSLTSLVCVPMVIQSEVRGLLVVYNKQDGRLFSEEDERLLAIIAAQSAQVVENARLLSQERELRLAKERALEADRAKSTFLANMSHELRTPLNSIIGYAEMLMDEAVEEEAVSRIEDLKKIRAAAQHQLELINNILDLSKVEAGKTDLYLEPFEVPHIVNEVVEIIAPLVKRRGNTLELSCPPDLGEMYADLTKIRQSLFNLLSNASKFTENGTVSLLVAREDHDDGAVITFTVKDTGIGMNDEQKANLFTPFSQASADTAKKYGGTGLGLAITKRFCEMMEGSITVDTAPGQGTAFTIHLPQKVRAGKALPGLLRTAGSR